MKCQACGIEKDRAVLEVYPYDDGIIPEPIDPFFELDCEPWEDVAPDDKWRRVTVCHQCFHRLQPDMWISSEGWRSLNPEVPFEALPLLEEEPEGEMAEAIEAYGQAIKNGEVPESEIQKIIETDFAPGSVARREASNKRIRDALIYSCPDHPGIRSNRVNPCPVCQKPFVRRDP